MTNADIAKLLARTADLLEIKGENPFKVRAYRNAARMLENSSKDFEKLVKEGFDLTRLPGIGKDLSEYIKEIVTTGKFSKLEELQKEVPPGLVDMLSIEGLGPKRIKQIYDAFGVTSLEELKKYAESGELDKLPGFGPKLIEKILKGVKQLKKAGIRFLWAEVEGIAEELREYLLKFEGVEIVEIAGSYRRRKETVGDLDILVIAEDYPKVSEYFIKFPKVKEVHSAGLTRSTVFLENDLQVDLRAVSRESYGAALHYFTGSKAHNIEVRKLAIAKGLKVNEYGVYKGIEKIAGATEEEVYEALGLEYIEPELRENRGEIEAAISKTLPKLVKFEDIKGDFSLSKEDIEEAKKRGYVYVGVMDLDSTFRYKKIKVLKVQMVEIFEDGSIEEIDKRADVVIGVIKSEFDLDEKTQTKRLIKAFDYINILAHPQNRIIQEFEGIKANWSEIFKAGIDKKVAFEVTAEPKRLDLSDVLIKQAKDTGAKIVLNSNGYSLKYALNQARRGWAEGKDVINTWELEKLLEFFKK
ncbi:helix-hairpin-helix domain-containing protein [Caminibacter sp.]